MKGNNQLPNAHFKKDWQGNTINGQCRVRTWLNQGAFDHRVRSFRMRPSRASLQARSISSRCLSLKATKLT